MVSGLGPSGAGQYTVLVAVGAVCSLAQSRVAGLKHHGFFCRRAVCTQGITQYWKPKNSVVFIKDNGSTKDLFTASMEGEKEATLRIEEMESCSLSS